MAEYLTHAARDTLLDLFLGGRRYTPPATVEFGLSLLPANESGLVVEPSHPSYARVAVPNDGEHFPWASLRGGLKANARDIGFPAPGGDWGVCRSLFVAEPGGAVLASMDLRPALRIGTSSAPVTLPAGAFRWRMPA